MYIMPFPVHNIKVQLKNRGIKMKLAQELFAFLMGYFIYSMIEILNRGFTHWTMALTGGLVMAILYALNQKRTFTLIKSCFVGALIITSIEFTVGVLVNLVMHWNVWDYSSVPMNIMGQICLPFSAAWFLLCIPAYYLCRAIRLRFEPKERVS